MKFNPSNLIDKPLENGKATFVVSEWEETVTEKGNDMITITLTVTDKVGSSRKMRDHFVTTDNMLWKLKDFCKSIGLGEQFESGEVNDEDAIDRKGVVDITRIKNTMADAKSKTLVVLENYRAA